MAFRKTVKCAKSVFNPCGLFSEKRMKPVNTGGSVQNYDIVDELPHEINDRVLPLMSLEDVKASGNVIQGNVSFAPNDPANLNDVQNRIGEFVDEVIANSNN